MASQQLDADVGELTFGQTSYFLPTLYYFHYRDYWWWWWWWWWWWCSHAWPDSSWMPTSVSSWHSGMESSIKEARLLRTRSPWSVTVVRAIWSLVVFIRCSSGVHRVFIRYSSGVRQRCGSCGAQWTQGVYSDSV